MQHNNLSSVSVVNVSQMLYLSKPLEIYEVADEEDEYEVICRPSAGNWYVARYEWKVLVPPFLSTAPREYVCTNTVDEEKDEY